MTRLEGSYDINQESSCRRRCCYNTTKSTCTTPGRQMKIGVVWQCLRLLFGVVILRQTTGAAALCEDLIVLEGRKSYKVLCVTMDNTLQLRK